jgi:Ca2+-binding RTX toxin-like protein
MIWLKAAGADSQFGGGGVDTLSYAGSAAAVTVNLATGAASGGDAAGDLFTGFENLVGSASADTLTGDGAANAITGGGGADTLNGGAGADVLRGGVGVDQMSGEDGADLFIWQRGDGDDQMFGGAGGGWLDVIDMAASNGALDYGTHWSINLTSGTFTVDAANRQLILSSDADGTISISATGETLTFQDMDVVRW